MTPVPPPDHRRPLALLTLLFFLWGFVTVLNDILIPHLKGAFDLNNTEAMLIQFTFFGAYFTISAPAGRLVARVGFRRGIVVGLCGVAAGCGLFFPAAEWAWYPAFLLALFVLAAGITVLQVAANPYVAVLGPRKTAASRLTLAQAFNSLGTALAPLFGAALILPASIHSARDATSVQGPYLALAALALAVAAVFSRTRLPKIPSVSGDDPHGRLWGHRHLVRGAVGIFLYVGAEVAIGSLLVFVLGLSSIAGLDEQSAGFYVALYWGAAMVGRFVGAAVQRRVSAPRVLAVAAVVASALVLVTVVVKGPIGMVAILAVGFANSIMFPAIFTLGIDGLGPLTSRGSGLLNMAIVGGAVVPLVLGFAADLYGYLPALALTIPCYGYILYYAVAGHRTHVP